MAWTKNDDLFMQSSSPIYDGNYTSSARPSAPAFETQWVTQVTKGSVTWFFNQSAEVAQFLNGDWQVKSAPGLTITSISPGWDGTLNGTEINPSNDANQGFDTRINNNTYDAALNAGTGTIDCSTEKSIVTSVSLATPEDQNGKVSGDSGFLGNNVFLDEIQILTVVDTLQAGFRPGYSGSDKSYRPTEADLNYAALASLDRSVLSSVPDIATLADDYQLPLIELRGSAVGAHLHPKQNMPYYGREIGKWLELATLSLQLDYTNAEKRDLLINVVQMGIDLHTAIEAGMGWPDDGGHHQGRKGVLTVAAKVLNNTDMLDNLDPAVTLKFSEDKQLFRVTQADIDRTNEAGNADYLQSDLGLAEWGERALSNPFKNDKNWSATYRTVAGCSMIGGALLAHIMNAKADWNNDTLFEYFEDRYWPTEEGNRGSTNGIQNFTASIWDNYGAS